MSVLSVSGLSKSYPSFSLKNVSFELQEGVITGFIGRNGAGKTTTLKSLLNFVHPDKGEIQFFGQSFQENEFEIKQKIGFVSGGISFYPKKKLRTITSVTKRFYPQWDEAAYKKYLKRFELDEDKVPDSLSAGMKVKYSLALALSHRAKLLLLDEPTSGLDPVSRDDLLDVFLDLVEEDGVTILFSTHITSDLEKCAEEILYLKKGEIIGRGKLKEFQNQFVLCNFSKEQMTGPLKPYLAGYKREKDGFSALFYKDHLPQGNFDYYPADLESIMIHLEKRESA
ncbi:ABC transporter ATP-binding protein [Ruminococcaceae bacterium BL-4]|nr:ABC transporter ATP-binding protein [Ruminococcaceae bacterium BL-4]